MLPCIVRWCDPSHETWAANFCAQLLSTRVVTASWANAATRVVSKRVANMSSPAPKLAGLAMKKRPVDGARFCQRASTRTRSPVFEFVERHLISRIQFENIFLFILIMTIYTNSVWMSSSLLSQPLLGAGWYIHEYVVRALHWEVCNVNLIGHLHYDWWSHLHLDKCDAVGKIVPMRTSKKWV